MSIKSRWRAWMVSVVFLPLSPLLRATPIPADAQPAIPLMPVEFTSPRNVYAVSFAPNGRTLFTCAGSGVLHRWDCPWDGQKKILMDSRISSRRLLFYCSPDGKTLMLSSEGGLILVDAKVGTEREWAGSDIQSYPVASAAPDGKTFSYQGDDGQFHLADLVTGKTIRSFEGKFDTGDLDISSHQGMLFSPEGKLAALGSGGFDPSTNSKIWIWDVASGRRLHSLGWRQDGGHVTAPWRMAFSADGKTLVSTLSDGEPIRVWDTKTGKVLHQFEANVTALALSPDGKLVVCGTRKGSLRFWHLPLGKELDEVKTGLGPIDCVSFSPDGRILASGGKNGIRLEATPKP